MERHRINLDFETRSRCDLPTCGAYKYAEDPSTEVLVIAVSVDGGDVVTWDYRDDMMDDDWQEHYAIHVLRRAIEEGWEIHAFNSQFEWCILKYVCPRQFGFPVPDINNMRCTAAVCRSAGLPPSLAAGAEFLKLPVQKDKAGKTLIQKFSVPQKDGRFIEYDSDEEFTVGGTRVTARHAFQMFVDYCKRDVETEMAVAGAMKPFELSGLSLETFLLTARLNDRGVPVDKTALENAMRLYQEHEAELEAGFQAITGLSPSQNLRVLEWVRERGYGGNSLDAENRARYGPGVTDPAAAKALAIKAELSFAAVKKIPAMLDWVQDDGFIRGSFLWCGAQKTGRWTSKGPQWQNMKKPKKAFRPLTGPAYDDIAGGIDLELLGLCYGNPYEVIASLSRYFVRYPDANIFDADFSQVEARILPQLIGCKRIMDSFGGGSDLYTVVGNRLGVDRDTGKTIVLATQFQGGWSAVFNATGKKWDRSRCEEAVKTVRDENPEFAVAWRRCQDAFVAAMDNPGKWQQATEYTRIAYTSKPPFPRVLLRLPSGRKIVMPYPKKDPITMVKIVRSVKDGGKLIVTTKWERHNGHLDDEDMCYEESSLRVFALPGENVTIESHFHTWELSFYGHVENSQYGRVNTYGGDILQSCTQAVGADLLACGVIEAERQGFEPFLLVHDQCLAKARGDKDAFAKALCTVPDWFSGFPLDASADEVRSYSKT